MMPKLSLLRWLLRQMLPATLVALPPACLYVLLRPGILEWRDGWAGAFVLAHSLWLTRCLGRFASGEFAFLYTRGFSRRALWSHTMLASLLAVLAVWAPAAAIVWTPLRGAVQDVLFRSPFFPIMAPREAPVPWAWLAGYALLLPTFHYEWIRRAQPTRGGAGGPFLGVGVIVGAAVIYTEGFRQPWFDSLALAAGAAIVGAMLLASARLHRRLEVRT